MHLSHHRLSTWYHQLAQQLDAGLSLAEALRLSSSTGALSRNLDTMAQAIEAGGSVDDALNAAREWLPSGDRLFLSAAAAAGRMPRMLHALSIRHAELGAAKIRVLIACLYPAAVLHLALLLLPVVNMIDWEEGFTWDAMAYLRGLGVTLLPLWIVGLTVGAITRRPGPIVARLIGMIPIVRKYVRTRALADFSFGLANFLEAGVPIDQAWAAAGLTSRSPVLKRAADAMGAVIARGEPPGPALSDWPCFPPEFVALYRTGEASGQLEPNLLRLSRQSAAQAQRTLTLATAVYPGLMFLAVAAGVGYFVITIYGGYLKMLTEVVTP